MFAGSAHLNSTPMIPFTLLVIRVHFTVVSICFAESLLVFQVGLSYHRRSLVARIGYDTG